MQGREAVYIFADVLMVYLDKAYIILFHNKLTSQLSYPKISVNHHATKHALD